jgi:tetratricopeptide (TPR) repeat protein
MRASGPFQRAALWVTVLMFLSSCSSFTRERPREREPGIESETARQAQQQFALGKYKKALEIYSVAYDKHHDADLRHGYVKIGEQIKAAADAAYREGDFAEAGSAYVNLFESGITTRDFAQTLSFDDDYLSGRIKACSNALLEMGMIKYREEKIEEAIAVWKKALVFDVDNRNIRNAIDTATVQLQQLKTLK